MVSAATKYVRDHWYLLPTPGPAPADPTCAVEAVGVSKACFFVFSPRATDPVCVVKVARTPHYNAVLEREYDAIDQVRRRAGEHLSDTLPLPLHTTRLQGHFAALETFLPGRTMAAEFSGPRPMSQETAERCLRLGAEWLAGFHRHAKTTPPPLSANAIQACMLQPVEELERTCKWDRAELGFLARLKAAAEQLEGAPIPLIFGHGDFEPGNILLDGDRVIVTDWQFGRPDALPLLDLLNLLLRYCFLAHGLEGVSDEWRSYRAAFTATLLTRSWLTEVAAPVIGGYLDTLGLRVSVPLFLALTLVWNARKFLGFLADRAERGYVYMVRTSDERPLPFEERLRDQLYVRLLRELASDDAFEALTVLQPA
jgi:thiamine kinase-like enzyme